MSTARQLSGPCALNSLITIATEEWRAAASIRFGEEGAKSKQTPLSVTCINGLTVRGEQVPGMNFPNEVLTNSQIAELLAVAAEDAPTPLDRAYRRASRRAVVR